MRLTKAQKAERESVKRFIESVGSDRNTSYDLQTMAEIHAEAFLSPAEVLGESINKLSMQAFRKGDMETLANMSHFTIMNAMLMGFDLGREYQKRCAMEEIFGGEK